MKRLSEIVSDRVSKSIKRIIIVTALLCLLIVICIMGRDSVVNIREESKLRLTEIDEKIDIKLSFIRTVSRTLNAGIVPSDSYSSYVDDLVNMYDDVSAVYICVPEDGVVYKDGINTYMSGGWVPPDDFVVSERAWYKELMNKDDVYLSEPYVDEQSGNICITISSKFNTPKGIGVIGLDMYLSDLVDYMDSVNNSAKYSILVSDGGTIITSFYDDFKLSADKSTNIEDTRYKIFDKMNYVKLMFDYKGLEKMGSAQKSDITGWTLIYIESVFYSSLSLLALIILIIAMMQISRVYAIKKLLKDINPMFASLELISNDIHNIKDGNLSYRFDNNKSSIDINNVIVALNDTIDGLNVYISEIDRVVNSISDKDLTNGVDSDFIGDYNSIKIAMNGVLDNLNDSFRQIKSNSDTVLEYSRSLASTSESVAEAATLQSHAVSSANEELEKLSISMMEIYKLANKVKETNIETNKRLTVGGDEMKELVNAMSEIVECFDGINNFVEEINGIASQTNLLSLNASIEAARAGEAGRSFAVVASEIQSLSVNSANASKNINEVIEKTKLAVNNGSELVERTQKTIELGIKYSVENTNITNNIVNEVSNQKESIEEITSSFKDISTMVESNAASAEENSAIATQLGECADALAETIDEYTLRA